MGRGEEEAEMKPFFIIIRGPLGIGKTTIAKELAKQLNAKYISIDEVLAYNKLDKIEGKSIPLKNFIKANLLIMPEVKQMLSEGKSIIFDGNFYHKEQIKDLINSLKYKNYVFTLKAPLNVCIARNKTRKRVYGKNATRAVYNLVSKFDYGIDINTNNKTIKEIVDEIKPS